MLRLISFGKALPWSVPLDPSVEFMPGMAAQLVLIGNQVMATVSDGTAPIGIIDDIRTKVFSAISWNEVKIIPAQGIPDGLGNMVLASDITATLDHPNINSSSFISTVKCILNSVNGVITFLAGAKLNYDLTGSGTPDAIKTVVNYTYNIPNMPGDDSTLGSGKVTVWYDRMIFQTTSFETNQSYVINQNIYVSEKGLLTSRRPSKYHPSIGMVTAPPSPIGNSVLELLWY